MANERSEGSAFPPGTGAPAARAFESIGVTSWRQLAGRSARELLQLHGVGPKAIRVVRAALREIGEDLSD